MQVPAVTVQPDRYVSDLQIFSVTGIYGRLLKFTYRILRVTVSRSQRLPTLNLSQQR
jgi:hypothetical protein